MLQNSPSMSPRPVRDEWKESYGLQLPQIEISGHSQWAGTSISYGHPYFICCLVGDGRPVILPGLDRRLHCKIIRLQTYLSYGLARESSEFLCLSSLGKIVTKLEIHDSVQYMLYKWPSAKVYLLEDGQLAPDYILIRVHSAELRHFSCMHHADD